jgi:glycerol-3-phosphate cytidylyltransferase-like family protein
LLAACRKIAGSDGRVIVAVNEDEFVEEFKKVRPTLSTEDRIKVVESCRYVDQVVRNTGWQDSTETIEEHGPVDFVVIGDDWAPPKDYYAQMGFSKEWLNSNEITLVYVDRNTGMSSTTIRQRLKS